MHWPRYLDLPSPIVSDSAGIHDLAVQAHIDDGPQVIPFIRFIRLVALLQLQAYPINKKDSGNARAEMRKNGGASERYE